MKSGRTREWSAPGPIDALPRCQETPGPLGRNDTVHAPESRYKLEKSSSEIRRGGARDEREPERANRVRKHINGHGAADLISSPRYYG